MSEWSFAVGPPGQIQRELNSAQSRRITFRLSEPSEASVVLDGWDPAAREIVELATDMYAYRRVSPGQPRRLLYRGRIGKTSDALDDDGHTVTVPSVDYRGVLQRRLLMNGFTQTFSQKDQGVIAWQLIADAQARPGGNLGITDGVGATSGTLRDRQFNLGDPIFEKIKELSEVIGGFEWDITPTDSNGALGLQLDRWYPYRGIVRNEVLIWTPTGSNLSSLQRTVDSSDYANAVRLSGKAPEGTSSDPAIQERPTPGTWHSPPPAEGRWDRLFQEDITTTAALQERADWRLADSMIVRPSYAVTLKPGIWRGPDHMWIGDTITLVVQSGRLNVRVDIRIVELSVEVDENGDESISLSLGYPRPDFKSKMTGIDRRLAKLERR